MRFRSEAGQTNQGINAVAVGYRAGESNQANNSIILNACGVNQENTQVNVIILNAHTTAITDPGIAATGPGFFAKPIRDVDTESGFITLKYNPTTGEIGYTTAP